MRAMRLGGPEAAEKARDRFKAAAEIDGKLWEAWYNLGVIDSREGNDVAAATSFSRALEVNPAHRGSLLGRAEAHRRAGEQGKARADYQQAVDQDPEDRRASARLASLLREAGKYDEALEVLREALRNSGAGAEVYVELSLIYLAQGRSELAALVVGKAADLDNKQPAIYNAMALAEAVALRAHAQRVVEGEHVGVAGVRLARAGEQQAQHGVDVGHRAHRRV
jgi:tetratricopeptide (TPR) repeat protein